MTLFNADGTELTETALTAQLTAITVPATFTVGQPVYEDFDYLAPVGNEPAQKPGTRLKWAAGQTISQTDINNAYLVATITSVTPATGTIAGGTSVTIAGTNLAGATAVTFGGTAATAVKVVDADTITCVTPAHAAGANPVAVTTEAGTVTDAGAFTYA